MIRNRSQDFSTQNVQLLKYVTWCLRAEDFTVFHIDESRRWQALRDMLGETFGGVIGCDYPSAYRVYLGTSGSPVRTRLDGSGHLRPTRPQCVPLPPSRHPRPCHQPPPAITADGKSVSRYENRSFLKKRQIG